MPVPGANFAAAGDIGQCAPGPDTAAHEATAFNQMVPELEFRAPRQLRGGMTNVPLHLDLIISVCLAIALTLAGLAVLHQPTEQAGQQEVSPPAKRAGAVVRQVVAHIGLGGPRTHEVGAGELRGRHGNLHATPKSHIPATAPLPGRGQRVLALRTAWSSRTGRRKGRLAMKLDSSSARQVRIFRASRYSGSGQLRHSSGQGPPNAAKGGPPKRVPPYSASEIRVTAR